jgi:sentrin-specific protease 1
LDEHQDKKNSRYDLTGWQNVTLRDIPQQENGFDCGVFMLKFADFLSLNRKPTFSQTNMKYFRRKLAFDILNKKATITV